MELEIFVKTLTSIPRAFVDADGASCVARKPIVREVVRRVGKNHIYRVLRERRQNLQAIPPVQLPLLRGSVRLPGNLDAKEESVGFDFEGILPASFEARDISLFCEELQLLSDFCARMFICGFKFLCGGFYGVKEFVQGERARILLVAELHNFFMDKLLPVHF